MATTLGVKEEIVKVGDTDIYDSGLKVAGLTKRYSGTAVVDDVSFGVQEGDTFALLGPNGAGKTTTFNMIRGEVIPNSGKILVNGISVGDHKSQARTRLGVCPQFDAMDKMAVYEILRFYGRLRGLVNVDDHVESVIEAVGLVKFRDRMAWKLSGGNKRKLSLGIALIGNPSVLLLDEPSSGMDAFAKRIMWQTLNTVSHGRSIVITTHSMEEADAIANRAGFLATRMLAVGETDALRESYGHVYHVHAICVSAPRTTNLQVNQLLDEIRTVFPGTELEDRPCRGQIRVSIPITKDLRISSLYRYFEEEKSALGIQYYSISPTSLEEVFLRIVGNRDYDENN
jgi:ABC-type multidrug transport system ATPase subunit